MCSKVTLEIIKGPMQGRRFVFEEHDTFLFGRSRKSCHARLPDDAFVSRYHFILEANPPEVRLRDLGSFNGTYVNGVKYGGREKGVSRTEARKHKSPQVDLKHGDIIQVGKTVFRVEVLTDRHDGRGTGHPAGRSADLESPLSPSPTVTESVLLCHQCGRDVSDEVPSGCTGDYLCSRCQDRLGTDPVKLLHDMIRKAAAEQSNESPPSITGYSIERRIGHGGMGVVYLGTRQHDQKKVAIKLMLSRVAVDPTARANFLREVQVLSGLRHPNIVAYLDSGAVESVFYFVMEYCQSGSLRSFLRRSEKPSLATLGKIMLQVLVGLSYAHEHGFVHRDLKPANVLIDKRDGHHLARISDFGLAKNFQKAGFSGMTATGTHAGTYPYMPREQLTNFKYVQPASDIWSTGAMFYYMLTGKTPRDFDSGRDPIEVVLEDRIVPIRRRRKDLPEAIAKVIDRAVASEVNDRFKSAKAMHAALLAALRSAV